VVNLFLKKNSGDTFCLYSSDILILHYMGFKIGCQPPFCKLSNIFYRFTSLRFQEGGINVSKRVKHMMIAHVVSAFCNYIFLRTYGGVLIAMTNTYLMVGLHICITSGLCATSTSYPF
jgi:hypothetical protein